MPHRNRHQRAESVEELRRGIESADELLIPALDLPEDTPETLARRARIQARSADERSRQALTIATDAKRDAWTKDQHRVFARTLTEAWGRMERRFYVLLITCTAVLAMLAVVSWNVWQDQGEERRHIEATLHELAEMMVISCETRNEQLRTSEEIYGFLALSLARDPLDAETALVLQDAQENLPDPVDCQRYADLAERP